MIGVDIYYKKNIKVKLLRVFIHCIYERGNKHVSWRNVPNLCVLLH